MRLLRVGVVAIAAVLAIPRASASVAWKPVYGARGSAMGGAVVASGFDATASLVNPALLVELDGLRVDFGTIAFYRPDEIAYTRAPDLLSPTGYGKVAIDALSAAPSGGVVFAPEERDWAFGFGINVPFADQLDWPDSGPNRY